MKGCREDLQHECGQGGGRLAAGVLLAAVQWWSILVLFLVVELCMTCVSMQGLSHKLTAGDWMGLSKSRSWLAGFCVGVFPACALTYILVLVAVSRQLLATYRTAKMGSHIGRWHRGETWVLTHARDVTIQVLFMPAVYHLMMCRCVLRLWSATAHVHVRELVYISHITETQKDQVDRQIAESDTGVAEMYDAYALWCFGTLAVTFVEEKMQTQNKIIAVLRTTTLLGVTMYVVTAVCSALYNISLSCMKVWISPDVCSSEPWNDVVVNASSNVSGFTGDRLFQGDSGFCTFQNIIYGANWATSTIAIYNLVYFEVTLHDEIQDFNPRLKFWSMKIPVTLAFSISLLKLVQPLTQMNSQEVDLLNACVKAYCMTCTSLLNIFAWKPTEAWYDKENLRDDRAYVAPHSEHTEAGSDTGDNDSTSDDDAAEAIIPPEESTVSQGGLSLGLASSGVAQDEESSPLARSPGGTTKSSSLIKD